MSLFLNMHTMQFYLFFLKQHMFTADREYFQNYYQTKINAKYQDPLYIVECPYSIKLVNNMTIHTHQRFKFLSDGGPIDCRRTNLIRFSLNVCLASSGLRTYFVYVNDC